MIRYIIVSAVGGLLFGLMDGIINGNSYARKLLVVYKPIAKISINPTAALLIDLAYGFILAGFFIILSQSLPGQSAILKGLSFAFLIWFLRVVMSSVSQYMMFDIPTSVLLYILITGAFEMLILSLLYAHALKPA
jgi:hypothetical protein